MVTPGLYEHYKGRVYVVYGTAKHSETLETLVLYHEFANPRKSWARPIEMFNEMVEVKGKPRKRFEWFHDQTL